VPPPKTSLSAIFSVRKDAHCLSFLVTDTKQITGEVAGADFMQQEEQEDRYFLRDFCAFLQDASSSILAEEFGKGNIPQR
jgi:hypothetical protein